MRPFDDAMPLAEARRLTMEQAELEGTPRCPCCTQIAKVYPTTIDSAMARTLIVLLRHGANEQFLHVPSLPGDNHKVSQLRRWGLVAEEKVRRPDGGRAGWWCLTGRGIAFTRRELAVPKYADVFDTRVLRLHGPDVTIEDCLGAKFRYVDVFAGVAAGG